MAETAEFTPEEKTPENQNHDEEMAQKYDQQADSGGESKSGEESSTEDKQQKDDSQDSEKESQEKSEEESEKSDDKSDDEEEQKQPSAEDFQRYQQEFAEKGELSDETYQELQEKYNLPKEVVDSYVQNQQAAVQAIEQAGYAAAGGQEQFQSMAQWAKQNLPEGELKEFNDQVNSGDVQKAVEAVHQLKQRYTDAVGEEPNLIEGDGSADTAPGYKSRAELTRDMNDSRYKKDPAFRAEVERKLRNSTIL